MCRTTDLWRFEAHSLRSARVCFVPTRQQRENPEDNAKQNTTVTYFYDTLTYSYTDVMESTIS
jgi:hypothetical protein